MADYRREYCSVVGHGNVYEMDEIVIVIYGPRGGTRALEGLSVDAARQLRDQLSEALTKFGEDKPRKFVFDERGFHKEE
jgi:hypothetical protein